MAWEAWATLGVIGLLLVALIKDVARPDLLMLGSLGVLLLLGILTPEDAFAGLSNSAVLAVGALFVVAAGVQNTGALGFADRLLFSRSTSLTVALPRFMLVTATLSAFLNNTPLVAMLIPRVQAWSERTGVSASKLMMPLSYAAIIGGMTTLIGTSTNLLVSGLMEDAGLPSLGLFDLTWIGAPAALAVIAYFGLIGHRLLPDRAMHGDVFEDGLTDCLFEVRVARGAPQVGKTVEEAGLRALGEAYLVHVRHGDETIAASPETVLRPGDVLTFRGQPSVLDTLLAQPGLEQVVENVEAPVHTTLPLFEAVVSPSSELVGRSLRDVDFRERYQGVVLGIRRREEAVEGPLGQLPIQPGDLLLIEAPNGFDRRWNQRRDEFYLVAPRRAERAKPQQRKAPIALMILVGVVLIAALGYASIVTTSFIGALAMIATGCLRAREARRSVDLPVLLVIAAALGLGRAIESSGLADFVAQGIVQHAAGFGTIGVIAAVYVATSLLTEVITNNAAAALMIGVGLAAARSLDAPPEAFALAVAMAASASFMTPIGYQTNLMVMAAGGYRFADYFRAGWMVSLIVGVIAVTMIWLLWL